MSTSDSSLGTLWTAQSGFCEQVVAPPVLPLTVVNNGASLSLSWPIYPGALYYKVYCGLSQDRMVALVDSLIGLSFTIGNLLPGQQYYVQVQAVLSLRSSVASPVVAAIPPVAPGATYFGFVSSTTPSASDIEAMPFSGLPSFIGDFTINQSGASANYPCFAFPVSLGVPHTFVFEGFQYGLQQSTIVINGIPYNVFVNPYATHAAIMVWTVN